MIRQAQSVAVDGLAPRAGGARVAVVLERSRGLGQKGGPQEWRQCSTFVADERTNSEFGDRLSFALERR